MHKTEIIKIQANNHTIEDANDQNTHSYQVKLQKCTRSTNNFITTKMKRITNSREKKQACKSAWKVNENKNEDISRDIQ